MAFLDLFLKFMFIGLIVLSLFSFITIFQSENEVENQFAENKLINSTFTNLTRNLNQLETRTQAQKDLFETENPTSGFGTILLFSIVSAGKTFNSMIVGVFNILIKLPVVFLGLDSTIVSVLLTVLGIVIILGLWAIYKLGG